MEPNRPKIGVGVLINNAENQFLLIKRKNIHGQGTWAPPGGHLELGEAIIECAHREAMEETNVVIKDAKILTLTEDMFSSEKHYITIWVSASYDSGELVNKEPEKCEDLGWYSVDQLPQPFFLSFANLLKNYQLNG